MPRLALGTCTGTGCWVRLLHKFPDAPYAQRARAAIADSLTPEHIAGELTYLRGAGRASFERPYGLAWLLQLFGRTAAME